MPIPPGAARASAEAITTVIAGRVRGLREASGLSQAHLAEKVAALGPPWTRATVLNLETRAPGGRGKGPGRDVVTSQELLALAIALDVPPVSLLADPVSGTAVPLAEGVELDPWSALLWMIGKVPLSNPSGSWDEAKILIEQGYQVATVIERFRDLQQHYEQEAVLLNGDEDRDDEAAESLRRILRMLPAPLHRLREWGAPLPPLPEDVTTRAAELGVELPGEGG